MQLGREQFVWYEKAENTSLTAFAVKLVPVYNKTDLLLVQQAEHTADWFTFVSR